MDLYDFERIFPLSAMSPQCLPCEINKYLQVQQVELRLRLPHTECVYISLQVQILIWLEAKLHNVDFTMNILITTNELRDVREFY